MKVNIGKFYHSNKPRKVDVKIEKCDTWRLDNTLAHIIHPALLQLKAEKQGTPWVDPADTPQFERGHCEHSRQNVSYSHEAWEWVLDEMIYAMQEIKDDNPGERTFYDESPISRDAVVKYHNRVQNGCRLFGVYFQDL